MNHDTTVSPWSACFESLVPLGDRLAAGLSDPADQQLRHELYRFMYMTVATGFYQQFYQDEAHPDFWPFFSTACNMAIINTDDTYYVAPISETGTYRIRGFRGTVHQVDFQLAGGTFFHTGIGPWGPTLRNFNPDTEAKIEADGSCEIMLSTERPPGHRGNWMRINPGATHLMIRQVSYDWANEVDGRYAIDRLDTPAIKPRDSAEKIAAQLANIPKLVENWIGFAHGWTTRLRNKGLINQLAVVEVADVGEVASQIYMEGMFDIGPEEALIVETNVPAGCDYWSFTLYTELWSAIDWQNRQSSLNGFTGQVDSDGRFRAVICAQDPGVPNWLDSAGYRHGGFFGRFSSGKWNPVTTKIKLADLRRHLPADTPVISAPERDAAIRLRRLGAQLRRRW